MARPWINTLPSPSRESPSNLCPKGGRLRLKKEKPMPKILVIEDDADMVEALRMLLEASDYQVFAAPTGSEGLQQVKEINPDLIILDAMMETATAGFQVSLQLRSPDADSEYAAYRNVPILMLTAIHATTSLEFSPDVAYLPVDDFAEKPIEPDLLLGKIKALTEQARET
jgi:CheY-like chemotaxis protein